MGPVTIERADAPADDGTIAALVASAPPLTGATRERLRRVLSAPTEKGAS